MAMLRLRFPGGRQKALTFSYDDGVEQDIRLVEILNTHGLKGTFNINTGAFAPEGTVHPAGLIHRRMTKSQIYDLFKDGPHEVAVHTLSHPYLEQMPIEAAAHEVLGDKMNIEQMFGKVTRGMAYPFGTYSDDVIAMLKSCGIAYSRAVSGIQDFALPENWLCWHPTCHHTVGNLMQLADRFLNEMPRNGGHWLFYVWGHSYEFEQANNWHVIEAFADRVAGHDEVWYATNIEIYDYVTAFRSLVCSADLNIVYNPTATEIFFNRGGKPYSIKPGETIRF